MKKIILFFVFLGLISKTEAQINVGIKLNPGIGYIRSSSLDKLAGAEKGLDPQVVVSNARTGPGGNIGIGGFYQYNINSKLSVLAEPTLNLLSTNIYLNYKKEELDPSGTGTQLRISSVAHIKLLYVNLPIVAKYTIWERKKVYAVGGFSANFNTKPFLRSEEITVLTDFIFENVKSETITKVSHKARLDNYNVFQPHLVIGVGKNFRRRLKNLSVDVRYSLPLSKSVMYSSDASLSAQSTNNSVFTSGEDWKMGNSATMQKRPDNFRLGMVNIAIKYAIYKKAKS